MKLIDLDRCNKATAIATSGYSGEMYRAPANWTYEQLDWKQLGLLAAESLKCKTKIS